MLFKYTSIDSTGKEAPGSIEAINEDVAISSLQRRGMVVASIVSAEKSGIFDMRISFFERVGSKNIVLLSRQISTLFEAQVSALRIFRLLAAESEKPVIGRILTEVADDLQGGSSISKALSKHPKIFSKFYISMVKAGEESGKLDETFLYLADHMERTHELTSKAKNAFIYPVFVIIAFVGVMVLMLTTVIPNLSRILIESGQELPIYTRIVMGISDLFVNYGLYMLVALIIGGFFFVRWARTQNGKRGLARSKISIPYVGTLYTKLYLSRIADNLNTMLASAIPIVKALEITAEVVDNAVYEKILLDAVEAVKAGSPVSTSLSRNPEIPGIMIQMMKVGEETGSIGDILKTLARFYRREVLTAVDTLIGLIEPVLVILLGLGVAFLLTSVLLPIYNISAGF
ncbi:MAG: type II secretion system F family protein [bacterium]|nr:type II secretion system F family protein [bacterium]